MECFKNHGFENGGFEVGFFYYGGEPFDYFDPSAPLTSTGSVQAGQDSLRTRTRGISSQWGRGRGYFVASLLLPTS